LRIGFEKKYPSKRVGRSGSPSILPFFIEKKNSVVSYIKRLRSINDNIPDFYDVKGDIFGKF